MTIRLPHPSEASIDIETLQTRIRAFGHTFDDGVNQATRDLYRPLVRLAAVGRERSDLPYGPHARQRLDVYEPAAPAVGAVVFVHGGGFSGGDKNGDGTFYVNVGRWLARHGWTAVLPNYRLAPDATWPSGARDIESVVQWVRGQAGDLAAADAPVVVWGQSAGAGHVASWAFDHAARGSPACAASAVMLMSGYYQVEAPLKPGALAYFGGDPTLYRARSPITHVAPSPMPLWLSLAGYDPTELAQQTYALARALTQANGRSPDFHFFRDHNHVSTVQSLGTHQSDVADEVLRFLRQAASAHATTRRCT